MCGVRCIGVVVVTSHFLGIILMCSLPLGGDGLPLVVMELMQLGPSGPVGEFVSVSRHPVWVRQRRGPIFDASVACSGMAALSRRPTDLSGYTGSNYGLFIGGFLQFGCYILFFPSFV